MLAIGCLANAGAAGAVEGVDQCAKAYKPLVQRTGYTPPSPGKSLSRAGGGPGCAIQGSKKPLKIKFQYAPAGCDKAYTNKSRILVDRRIVNCPGAYPAIFFFHGNDGWNDLETNIGAVSAYENVLGHGYLWGKTKVPDFQPVIVVFLSGKGKNETLWPNLELGALKQAVLEKLRSTPETKGVTFSSVSVAAHSGSGCNEHFWARKVTRESLYAAIYADTCFGYYDRNHNPAKLISVVSQMDNTDYFTFAKAHGMERANSCRKSYRGPSVACYQHPTNDYYLFYHNTPDGKGRNHGWPIGLTFMFALENFFSAAAAQGDAPEPATQETPSQTTPDTASTTPTPTADQATPATGQGESKWGPKPEAKPQDALCRTRQTCAPYCLGSSANQAKVLAAIKKLGHAKPSDVVDPAVAVQEELRRLGCEPQGGKLVQTASQNCGIVFRAGERALLHAVIPGLARAALAAKQRGYVLSVGSTYRSPAEQMSKSCAHVGRGDIPCGGSTGLACPGGSPHGSGYAIDTAMCEPLKGWTWSNIQPKFCTPPTGDSKSCALRTKEILRTPRLKALNEIMFGAGWWKYCEELWHFEYTTNPSNKLRTKEF
jgi:D-alanyl-D-alanine dipeptidase